MRRRVIVRWIPLHVQVIFFFLLIVCLPPISFFKFHVVWSDGSQLFGLQRRLWISFLELIEFVWTNLLHVSWRKIELVKSNLELVSPNSQDQCDWFRYFKFISSDWGVPLVQVHGGGNGEIRDPPTGAVTRVFSATAEAEMYQRFGWTADDWQCGGRASTGQAVRCSGPLPQVHETGCQPFQGRWENWRMEVLAGSWSLARAPDSTIHGRSRIGN